MKKYSKILKTLFAAAACGIIGASCAKTDQVEARALPGIPPEDARPLGQIGHSTKMFTAEEVAQNIRAATSAWSQDMAMIEGSIGGMSLQIQDIETQIADITETLANIQIGPAPVYPAVVTNSIVAGDQTLLVLSPDPNGGTVSQLPPFVTNAITAGDQTLLVLSPAE